jgi:hypothetical protein
MTLGRYPLPWRARSEGRRIEDVPMVCDMCGSIFRLGDCEAKDAHEDDGPYDGEIGCPVPDCGGTMKELRC